MTSYNRNQRIIIITATFRVLPARSQHGFPTQMVFTMLKNTGQGWIQSNYVHHVAYAHTAYLQKTTCNWTFFLLVTITLIY